MKLKRGKRKKSNLKIVWFFIRKYKLYFMFIIGLALLVGILESITVGLMYPIIDGVLDLDAANNTFLNLVDPFINKVPINDSLIRYSVVFLAVALLVSIMKIVYYFLSVKFSAKVVTELKKDVFNKCINSDYQFFVDNKQGELLYKTSQAPNSINGVLQVLSDVFLPLFLSVSVFIMLLTMSWKLVIIISIGALVYFYLVRHISISISYKTGKEKIDAVEKEQVIVTEYTRGIKQIKVFETFDYWKKMFDKTIDKFWFQHRKNYFWHNIPQIFLWLLLYTAIGGTIISIKLLYPGRALLILPLIGTFATGVFIVLPKLSQFGGLRMRFMHFIPNLEVVYNLLQDKSYFKIKNGTKKFTGLKNGLFLKNVTFSHKEREILFKNISMEIKKDKTTALVGPSGSGKSTIVNLLLRLYDGDKGSIHIDDSNIKDYDIYSFRDKIGFVSQDTFIYNASVKENISFGREYTEQEIKEAARMANADEFIRNLPEGYNTLVGDQGMKLSGGEKQRIAIARAVIRKPEILILDEATSSLDNISENLVQKAIEKISKNCTTFIIAHRLSTIINADVINVLDEGKIVEKGTHNELLKQKGKYWELYNMQKSE